LSGKPRCARFEMGLLLTRAGVYKEKALSIGAAVRERVKPSLRGLPLTSASDDPSIHNIEREKVGRKIQGRDGLFAQLQEDVEIRKRGGGRELVSRELRPVDSWNSQKPGRWSFCCWVFLVPKVLRVRQEQSCDARPIAARCAWWCANLPWLECYRFVCLVFVVGGSSLDRQLSSRYPSSTICLSGIISSRLQAIVTLEY
jgi:hypothetical protein